MSIFTKIKNWFVQSRTIEEQFLEIISEETTPEVREVAKTAVKLTKDEVKKIRKPRTKKVVDK